MKTSMFKCDQCGNLTNHVASTMQGVTPYAWITVFDGKIADQLSGKKTRIIKMEDVHFCSKSCFIDYVFNDLEDTNNG